MPGNSFGQTLRLTTWGESHGPAVGAVLDGCPAGLNVAAEDIQAELDRRKPGTTRLSSQRREPDTVEILSGVFEGRTIGTPISMLVHNQDVRSGDYEHLRSAYRPSHADYTYDAKFGRRDWRGGGRASARETVGRVCGGAIAQKLLRELHAGLEIVAFVERVGDLGPAAVDLSTVRRGDVDANDVRCPDVGLALEMISVIDGARKQGNTLGGIICAVARGVPPGWGEPVFDKLEAELAAALLSLPACKGFESGSGFSGTRLLGSDHNDVFYRAPDGRIRTRTNHSGGIQGGISNGEAIVVRAAFKPVATLMRPQESVDNQGQSIEITGRGRHDPCVLPRAVPLVEAMMALVLADQALRHKSSRL